jgi:transcriptional regulator with XRE-family HTH domain
MSPVAFDSASTSEFTDQVLYRVGLALMNSDMTGRELCKQLGVSHNWLNKRLMGDQSPTLADLQAISNVLGVGITELLGCRQSTLAHPVAKELDEVLTDKLMQQADKDRILGILGEMIRWAYQRTEQAAPPAKRRRALPPAPQEPQMTTRKTTPRKARG